MCEGMILYIAPLPSLHQFTLSSFPPVYFQHALLPTSYVYQHAWHDTERALINQLPEWSDTLRIDKYPLHSGTVAQIYRGVLATAGQEEVSKTTFYNKRM